MENIVPYLICVILLASKRDYKTKICKIKNLILPVLTLPVSQSCFKSLIYIDLHRSSTLINNRPYFDGKVKSGVPRFAQTKFQ